MVVWVRSEPARAIPIEMAVTAIASEKNGGIQWPNEVGKSGIASPAPRWRMTAPIRI